MAVYLNIVSNKEAEWGGKIFVHVHPQGMCQKSSTKQDEQKCLG